MQHKPNSLFEAAASILFQEAIITGKRRDRLDDLISMASNGADTSTYDDDAAENVEKAIAAIKKEFGEKIAKQVDDGLYIMHFGRKNNGGSSDWLNDKLRWRKQARITKQNKMNKSDVQGLKSRIKDDLKDLKKKINLP
jgi:hypothetical protein